MSGSFLDSNVILYLLSDDDRKRAIAKTILEQPATISVQVLNEIVNVARRKNDLAWGDIDTFIDELRSLIHVEPLTVDTHNSARQIAARYGFAFYDALIAASALSAKCTTLLTEDMQHGQKINDLTIVNPFLLTGDVPQ